MTAPLDPEDIVTRPDPTDGAAATAPSAASQVTPGMRIGRYRVLSRLGSGGMGDVVRAFDEELGQDVALKFLNVTGIAGSLDILRNEVRLARMVSHPSVCRVHDLGEADGRHFLSMEFVDGESLDRLLRRIGRLPPDKALDIGKQLAAGLHAAHEQGVLHRDLKPANVMIDGRGDVRITDFGIAGLADGQATGAPGTPAYMAPELFAGAPATVASDVYSLGLVLHELFTGRRVFQASSMTELLRQHRRPVEPPSQRIPGMDPDVEDVILRCLEREPSRRPASALAVLARLSGRDLLAEVLRSGKTPSPAIVAASETRCGLCTRTVVALVAVFVAVLATLFWLEPRIKLVTLAPLPQSSEVLAADAKRHLTALGIAGDQEDRAFGFDVVMRYVSALGAIDRPDRFVPLADPAAKTTAFDFWYRTSPEPLVATHLSGTVTDSDPPVVSPGMVAARLDPRGHLRELHVVPVELTPPAPPFGAAPPRVSWPDPLPRERLVAAVFTAAGLEPSAFEPAPPSVVPPEFADERLAWRATDDSGMRIELAVLDGRPVALRVFEEAWRDATVFEAERWDPSAAAATNVLRLAWLVAAVVLAWRALRSGRGDRIGAVRVGLAVFAIVLAVTLLVGNHSSNLAAEGQLWLKAIARGALVAAQYALYYLALEPHVRRFWPETLIPWSRLLAGRIADPVVGFSVLVGTVVGLASALLALLGRGGHAWFDGSVAFPLIVRDRTLEVMQGGPHRLGALLEIVAYYADLGMGFVLGLVLLARLFRRRIVAAIAMGALQTAAWAATIPSPNIVSVGMLAIVGAMAVVVAVRIGMLALLVALFTFRIATVYPLRTDLDHWLGAATVFAVVVLTGAVAWGAWAALRPGGTGFEVPLDRSADAHHRDDEPDYPKTEHSPLG